LARGGRAVWASRLTCLGLAADLFGPRPSAQVAQAPRPARRGRGIRDPRFPPMGKGRPSPPPSAAAERLREAQSAQCEAQTAKPSPARGRRRGKRAARIPRFRPIGDGRSKSKPFSRLREESLSRASRGMGSQRRMRAPRGPNIHHQDGLRGARMQPAPAAPLGQRGAPGGPAQGRARPPSACREAQSTQCEAPKSRCRPRPRTGRAGGGRGGSAHRPNGAATP
jgi:hypothetical protein